jgi:predicted transcriptional regulator
MIHAKKSKLEVYECLLEMLANQPSNVDLLAYFGNMSCVTVQERIGFLVRQGLVEEKIKEKVYALTRRGLAVINTLRLSRDLEKLHSNAAINPGLEESPLSGN